MCGVSDQLCGGQEEEGKAAQSCHRPGHGTVYPSLQPCVGVVRVTTGYMRWARRCMGMTSIVATSTTKFGSRERGRGAQGHVELVIASD